MIITIIKMRFVKQRAILAGIALLFYFCSPVQAQPPSQSYLSPLDNFSLPIPLGVGQRVQDENDNNGGKVAFHDDFGNYKSIFYLRLSPRSLELQSDPEAHRANLERFFNEYAMRWFFKQAFSNASVLHGEYTKVGGDSAYFVLVNLPKGSTLYDTKARKRCDTKRGMLVFTKGLYIYMLGSGESPFAPELNGSEPSLELLVEREKNRLNSFASTITFK